MEAYYQIAQRLPGTVKDALQTIPQEKAALINEIRLRSSRKIVLVQGSRSFALDSAEPLSHALLQECCLALCGYSLHAIQSSLSQGYFTLPGGHRVGVAGNAVWANGKIQNFKTFYSLNIRIARRDDRPLEEKISAILSQPDAGILLIGPPGSGKTTLLRKMACALSQKGEKVCVLDTRSEIFPGSSEGYSIPPPLHCDVWENCPKAKGIEFAVRTLAPQTIVCDEVGSAEEAAAILDGLNAGVRFVMSMHGRSVEQTQLKPQYKILSGSGAFQYYILLGAACSPGQILKIGRVI